MKTETTISQTAAIQRARSESSMHRQGTQWVPVTWNEAMGMWHEGHAREYNHARIALLEWRFDRVMELVGREDLVGSGHREYGSLEARVAAALGN